LHRYRYSSALEWSLIDSAPGHRRAAPCPARGRQPRAGLDSSNAELSKKPWSLEIQAPAATPEFIVPYCLRAGLLTNPGSSGGRPELHDWHKFPWLCFARAFVVELPAANLVWPSSSPTRRTWLGSSPQGRSPQERSPWLDNPARSPIHPGWL